ncbi:MAG TPA: DUF1476 domain-containing protein [Acetobacteraceae bacterium]
MTIFDEREQAFENKFGHDQELLFRIRARRARLLGHWVAERLGLSGDEAGRYALELVEAEVARPGEPNALERAWNDLEGRGLGITRSALEHEAVRLLDTARHQVLEET